MPAPLVGCACLTGDDSLLPIIISFLVTPLSESVYGRSFGEEDTTPTKHLVIQ